MTTGIIQRPTGKSIPHSGFGDKALWICMRPMELIGQTTGNRGIGIEVGQEMDTFKFLAPPNIMETVSHGWEAYESMTSRLQEKQREALKLRADVTALGQVAGKVGAILTTGTQAGMVSELKNAANINIAIPKTRVDSPLVYTSSERREWNFTFQLVSSSEPLNDVVWPIKELMRYSCPEAMDTSVAISLPYVFKLYTEPGNLFYADYAALTSVQPTWKEPYRDGYPTGVELTVTFKDLSPLFRSLIERSQLVNVI